MSCQHLVCAHCSGPVAEGRCAVCRMHRAQMHRQQFSSMTAAIVALMVLLVTVAALADQFAG